MKKFLFFLFAVFFLSLTFNKSLLKNTALQSIFSSLKIQKKNSPKVKNHKKLFQASLYPIKNHHFTIVVVGKNNGAYLPKVLKSIFQQNYNHFTLVYIDDASDDGSFSLAKDMLEEKKDLFDIEIHQNSESLNVENLYQVAKNVKSDEIILYLEGQDMLAHEWVLQRLNAYFINPELWFSFGKFLDAKNFKQTSYKQDSGFAGHVQLFVKEKNLSQISDEHYTHIDEVLFLKNL